MNGGLDSRSVCRLTLLLVSGAMLGPAAIAQSAADKNDNGDTTKPGGLTEVVVSARRVEENVQRVPIAITVVSQESLQENNIQTFGNLQYLVPAMSAMASVLTRDAVNLSIRGQGANTLSSVPGVVSYINEVPIPTVTPQGDLAGGPGLLFDLQNVQILKGPQGTNFGRNSMGGALLLQSARPTNELGGRVEASYGNFDARALDAAINIPVVSDKLLTRIAFNGQKRDGFTRLLGSPGRTGSVDTDDRDFWSARATVTYRPFSRLQNDTIFTYSDYSSNGSPTLLADFNPNSFAATLFPGMPAAAAQQDALGVRKAIAVDAPLESSGTTQMLNNVTSFELSSSLTLRNILGYDRSETTIGTDTDGSPFRIYEALSSPNTLVLYQLSEEPQLLGRGFAGGKLDWVVGGFYLDSHSPYSVITQTIFGNTTSGTQRALDRSKALYSWGNYELADGLSLNAGARYTWDDRGIVVGTLTDPPVDTIVQRAQSSALTWTVALNYQITPDTLLYVTGRRGYRSGGANNITPGVAPFPDYSPEHVLDSEVGMKSDWIVGDRTFRTNVAVFYQDYKDIQVNSQSFLPNGAPVNVISNAAAARVWGGEFEALAQVTDNLQFGADFNYLSFKYTDFGSAVNPGPLDQTRYLNRPPRKYGVNARYRMPLSPQVGELAVRANYNWQARSGDYSQPFGEVDAFGLLNMTVDWDRIGGKSMDVSLFASNLTNEEYTIGVRTVYNSPLGFAIRRYGEPRMYGIRLRYRFGE